MCPEQTGIGQVLYSATIFILLSAVDHFNRLAYLAPNLMQSLPLPTIFY